VLGVVLMPVIGIDVTASVGDISVATADFDALIVSPAALVAAFACYATWWIRPGPGIAWATIGLAALAFQELVRAALQLVTHDPVPTIRVLAADVSAALAIVLAIALGQRLGRRPDPAAVGFFAGALVATGRLYLFDAEPELGQHLNRALTSTAYAVTLGVVAALLWWGGGLTPRIGSLPAWVRQRTALALALIGVAHVTLYLSDTPTARIVVLLGDVAGAVLLVTTYLALFIREVQEVHQSYDNLDDELERARLVNRDHSARLHEINATIAGITSASQLLRTTEGISEPRRAALVEMLDSELDRLARLVAPPSPEAGSTGEIDLDATIGPLVVSHQARGRHVTWSPSGLRVRASRDAVAEMVNVLLDNAARHARSGAEVTVTRNGEHVEVVVHDDGPGVDRSLLDRIFEWGVRGPGSDGQGIGLNVARRLAQQEHGFLRLGDTRDGATFVLGLPVAGVPAQVPTPD
jgi:signal transduction histidine kinase